MTDVIETVDEFRQRARRWLEGNMPRQVGAPSGFAMDPVSDDAELAEIQHQRDLQRMLFEAGLAGICFPKEYGGQGLTPAHAEAFNEEIVAYDYPSRIQVPTFSPCAALIMEFGTEDQKKTHIPAMLRGEEIMRQLLSEPSGGSDVASAQTTAQRDGEEWVLNGSKIWTSGAWWSDWGLCLARTNWDVPKHRGLSVFMLKIHQPGIDVHRIEMLNGYNQWCQEFFSDVRIPDRDRIGEVDDGWTVALRWMFHEKSIPVSPFTVRPAGQAMGADGRPNALLAIARAGGRLDDPLARDRIGEAHTLSLASKALAGRVARAISTGQMADHGAALIKLMSGTLAARQATLKMELAGPGGVAWEPHDEESKSAGVGYLVRQAISIGGGTTEMARNVVSERVLGMPREPALDRDIPFRDVPRGPRPHAQR
jgi:alkylation response protein AidB-like acyl-CoA dehydrogenase